MTRYVQLFKVENWIKILKTAFIYSSDKYLNNILALAKQKKFTFLTSLASSYTFGLPLRSLVFDAKCIVLKYIYKTASSLTSYSSRNNKWTLGAKVNQKFSEIRLKCSMLHMPYYIGQFQFQNWGHFLSNGGNFHLINFVNNFIDISDLFKCTFYILTNRQIYGIRLNTGKW